MLHSFGNETWLRAAVYKLRYDVFVLEQGILPEDEFEDTPSSLYFLVTNEEKVPIATIRYQACDNQTINPDRFCIAKAFRGQGIGRALLDSYEKKAKSDGYIRSELSAETSDAGFYEKAGYQTISDTYLEDGILCVPMAKNLV